MQPLQHLLAELVDYAGLFPPAALGMSEVVGNYARYQSSHHRWMLARLVVPQARLPEFEHAAAEAELPPSRISLLTPALDAEDNAFARAVEQLTAFNERSVHAVDAVEVRVSDPGCIGRALQLPNDIRCFVEFPIAQLATSVAAIAELSAANRVFAKIRTGGVTPDLIPDCRSVAEFLCTCASCDVGLKATAGLHHPFRAEFPLTYEPGCDRGVMHGFLNVFVGACLMRSGQVDQAGLTEFLESCAPGELDVSPNAITWRDVRLDADSIARGREFAVSFGSCSFTEPVEDLDGLNLLPEAPYAAY